MTNETGICKRCDHDKIRHKWTVEHDVWWRGSFLVPHVHSWGQCSECDCDKFK